MAWLQLSDLQGYQGEQQSGCHRRSATLPAHRKGLPVQEPPMRQLMFDQLLTSASRCYIELGKQYEALGELSQPTACLTAEHSPAVGIPAGGVLCTSQK